MMRPTYEQIASDFRLWAEYMDPGATMTEQQFDALSIASRIAMLDECFGGEERDEG